MPRLSSSTAFISAVIETSMGLVYVRRGYRERGRVKNIAGKLSSINVFGDRSYSKKKLKKFWDAEQCKKISRQIFRFFGWRRALTLRAACIFFHLPSPDAELGGTAAVAYPLFVRQKSVKKMNSVRKQFLHYRAAYQPCQC